MYIAIFYEQNIVEKYTKSSEIGFSFGADVLEFYSGTVTYFVFGTIVTSTEVVWV